MAETACMYCGEGVELSAAARERLRDANLALDRRREQRLQPVEVAVCHPCYLTRHRVQREEVGASSFRTMRVAWLDFVRHTPSPLGHGGMCCSQARGVALRRCSWLTTELDQAIAVWVERQNAKRAGVIRASKGDL